MNPDVLRHTQAIAATVLANVDADQLPAPTPCASWNVGQLIDHLIGAQNWAAAGISGRPSESAEGASAGDFTSAYANAAEAAARAFEEEGALARTVNPGFGDMPATALLGLAIVDTFTHAWDLAKATGQSTDLDSQLATQLLAASKQSIPDAYRGPEGAPFGVAQAAPEGVSAADQLAAFLGRAV